MTTTKEILSDILNAHCLSTENTRKVYELSGIKAQLFNGKRNYYQIRNLLLRAISDEKAKEIINKMPFPFIGQYYGTEHLKDFVNNSLIKSRDYMFWIDNVLMETPKKRGYKILNHDDCGITYR